LPFSIADSANALGANSGVPSGIPRYTPSTPITNYSANGSVSIGPNQFGLLNVPIPNESCNPAWMLADSSLGSTPTNCIETFGPFPSNMTARNAFRGPGAWNADFAVGKNFQLTERVSLQFRAEAFDIFNHHNMYVNGYINDTTGFTGPGPFVVTGKKGGLGSLAGSSIVTGTPADERRFGQFSLRVSF
jgi:hypothetical protein